MFKKLFWIFSKILYGHDFSGNVTVTCINVKDRSAGAVSDMSARFLRVSCPRQFLSVHGRCSVKDVVWSLFPWRKGLHGNTCGICSCIWTAKMRIFYWQWIQVADIQCIVMGCANIGRMRIPEVHCQWDCSFPSCYAVRSDMHCAVNLSGSREPATAKTPCGAIFWQTVRSQCPGLWNCHG